MGAYLSEPIVKKISAEDENDFLKVGSSSMQGWRISQEDAHNCILQLEDNTSYFAVYDGHGGAEVASYCADNLPDLLKNLASFKEKNFEIALREAFLSFDATLLNEDVITKLKSIAGEQNPYDSDNIDDSEELNQLCQEGSLPLDKVLEKYKIKTPKGASLPVLNKLKKDEPGGSGSSKPLSPCLRGRLNPDKVNEVAGSSSTKSDSNQKIDETNDDSQVSSSGVSSEVKIAPEITTNSVQVEIKSNEADSASDEILATNGDKTKVEPTSEKSTTSPDSSIITIPKENKILNGDIKAETSSGVSSSSTAESSPVKKTNGKVSSPSKVPSKPTNRRSTSSFGGISSSVNANAAADDSSSDSDADFNAGVECNSETDDGEEDCETTESEEEEEEEEDEYFDDNEDEEYYEMDDDDYKEQQFCSNIVGEPGKDSGCTAVVALLHGRDLYVANAGDSRCVVCRDGKAIDLSMDHKPEDEEESDRIVKAGGRVTLDGRVNGGLNLSRAIGDHAYKMNTNFPPEEQMISALPDIKKLILEPQDEFMILACDGIWNYMSSEEVVAFVKERLDDDCNAVSKICEELFELCLAPNTLGDGTGCDNMTAIIIRFKPTILELPTHLNPDETITGVNKESVNAVTTETKKDDIPKAKKRSASPTPSDSSTTTSNNTEEEHSTKRLKTDEPVVVSSEAVAADDISRESNSQSSMDADAAEADAAAASITTTSSDA